MSLQARDLAQSIVQWLDVGIFVLDPEFRVLLWNNFMAQHSGKSEDEVLGRNLFELFPELPKPWFSMKVKTVLTLNNFAFISWENRPYLFRFAHNRPITGAEEHMYQNCVLMPVKDRQSESQAVCVVLMDATDVALAQRQLQEAMQRLAESSNRDGLTGVYNRRHLEERMEMEFQRVRRYGGTYSLVLFDMDHFKKINDNHGHLGGDAVLVDIARRAEELLRATDVLGRYGGEEFCILLPNTPLEGAMMFCERLRHFVQQCPVQHDGIDIPVTISVGVTEYQPEDRDYRQLIHRADVALYASKAGGRNRVTPYTPDLEDKPGP